MATRHKPTVTVIVTTSGDNRWIMECPCGAMSARDSRADIGREVNWHLARAYQAA